MELQYAGALIANARTRRGGTPASLLGTGVLIAYDGHLFVLTSSFSSLSSADGVDLMAITKVHDGSTARRIHFGLNTNRGYSFVHPQDKGPITHGLQLFYINNELQEIKNKGLVPFPLPQKPDFPQLQNGQYIRILGLHARQINQKVLAADDLVLPWSMADATLLSGNEHDLRPSEHSAIRFKQQFIANMSTDDITDDWMGALVFAELSEGWAPIGIQSLFDAHLINPQIITQQPDHPPLLGICPLQSVYDVLSNLPM